jgi:hypothetical protein
VALGEDLVHSIDAQHAVRQYVRNIALWLAGRPVAMA